MIGSLNKLLRNVASLKGKSAFDKVSTRACMIICAESDKSHILGGHEGAKGEASCL